MNPDYILGVTARDRFNNVFNNIDDIARMPQPTFAYLHLISPHPPFVFDANGNPTDPAEASRIEALRELRVNAGLEGVEMRKIAVQRTFTNFDDFWAASTAAGSVRLTVDALSRDEAETVKTRLRAKLPADAQGRITLQFFC